MNLYESIPRRRSCRKYVPQPLPEETLHEMDEAIKGFEQLYPDLPLAYRFAQKVKGRFRVEAPHYLIISGQGKPGEMENAGYVFQQLVLWLDAMEMGSVWLGSSKDVQAQNTGRDIITIAFGHAAEPVHRAGDQFVRKPVDKITNAPEDLCVQAAHLAPSGMNTQPWYFQKQGDQVMVYKQRLKPPISLLYKLSDVDMGIALCHYALACKESNRPFRFRREAALPDKTGYLPFGMIA